MSARECPCGSGAAYAACCAPLHRGEREAESATALMRSRFAAFATKDVDYLWRTLHRDHEDRARPKDAVVRAIRDACEGNRYLALRVLDAKDDGDAARVLFAAKVFAKGKDRSFVECSDFAREGGAWRYVGGEGAACPFDPSRAMTIDAFVGRA